jgi:GcrA cell cycle regulator
MWTADKIEVLKSLWAAGKSAAQIAAEVGKTRSACCAKLQREGLKRGHKPPTASPKIVSRPRQTARRSIVSQGAPAVDRKSALPLRPLRMVVSPRQAKGQPVEFTKTELQAMLAAAVRNTG